MRCYAVLLLCALSVLLAPRSIQAQSDDCNVRKTLEARDLPVGSLAVDGYGSVVDASYLLVPISLDQGRYEVTVTQEADNLYSVSEANLYLRTSLCLELSVASNAILEVRNGQGAEYSFGILYFID